LKLEVEVELQVQLQVGQKLQDTAIRKVAGTLTLVQLRIAD
jgi:hypothetical protein